MPEQQKPITIPSLESVVQRMIDANESDENIATVIQHYKGGPNTAPPTELKGEPTDFWGGFRKSITSGEAFGDAGTKGALGWLKGATVDLPGSIMGGLKSVGNLISDPVNTIRNMPGDIANMGRGIKDTFMQAGHNPEAFGEMMGQMGGQPLVTAGITKGVPMLRNPVGRGIETIGNTMEKYQPVSGMIPRIAEARTMRNVERAVGKKVSAFGSKIQKPIVKQGEVVPPKPGPFEEGQFTEVPPQGPPALNAPESTILPNSTTETRQYRMLPEEKPLGLPPTDTSFYGNVPIQNDPTKLLPRFGGSTVNPLVTKSIEAPVHPLDELVNSLKLDPGAITSFDDNNNIISNFQKRQPIDTLQNAPESPRTGPVFGTAATASNEIDDLIAQLRQEKGQATPPPNPATVALPTELQTSKIWYNIGKKRYQPLFENELDKAKFVVGQSVPIKNDPGYLKFIMDKTGLDEAAARADARQYRIKIKAFIDGQKPGVINIPSIGGGQ